MTATRDNSAVLLIALMAVQFACAVFFVADAALDFMTEGGWASLDGHLGIEILATATLLAAIAVEGRLIRELMRRKAGLEQSLANASAEVHAVIEAQFREWHLSPAEHDIAMFLVKGFGTSEIAEMRASAEGTIKAHIAAVFRKSGVHSRAELLSVLIDRLLGKRLDQG